MSFPSRTLDDAASRDDDPDGSAEQLRFAPASTAGPATAADASPLPRITLIIPTLNEERYIAGCLNTLLDTDYPPDRIETLVVDGGSTDRTVAIVEEMAAAYPRLRVLRNPKRIQSAALNLGIAAADPASELVIRADAHAFYPPDFIRRCVEAQRRSRAEAVVFIAAPAPAESCFQSAVALAQSTPLGVGNSWYRLGGPSKDVEHGFHGCFERSVFARAGTYDETFSHNEDWELSHRIRQSGGRVFLESSLRVGYVSRDTLRRLVRQYFSYGKGRARTTLKHRLVPSARQLAPAALIVLEVLWLVLLAAGGLVPEAEPPGAVSKVQRVAALLGAGLGLYGLVLAAAGLFYAARRRSLCALYLPVALAAMHHAWGAGFLAVRVPALFGRRWGRPAAAPAP